MAGRSGGKIGQVVVWVLLALLIVGLAGFGIGSFGGSATTVARAGREEVTAQEYLRLLAREVRALQIEEGRALSRAEAEARGLLAAVQGRLITSAALDDETRRLGLSVGDETVGEQVLAEPAFRDISGQFDRDTYERALRQVGYSVPDFEAELRAEAARALVSRAVAAGVSAPEGLSGAVAAFLGERRSLSWARVGPESLAGPVPEPDAEALRATYEARPDAYTVPETKRITYAILRPETLAANLDPDPEAVRALYEERRAEFVAPERRLVERLVFPDAGAALDARAAIAAGEATFVDVVRGRGLRLADVDLGEVTEADLGGAGEAVFALDAPGLTGPHATDLGPALFRVNAILDARNVPLAQVADDLGREVTIARARRTAADMVEDLEDRLAAGATLEDLAAETAMELGTLDWRPGVDDGVAGYEAVRAAAAALGADDFPRIIDLEDGALFALRLDEVVPPRLPPLAEVRAAVAEDWRAAALAEQLTAEAERRRDALAPGDALEATGLPVDRAEAVTRDAFLPGVPEALVGAAFDAAPDTAQVLPAPATTDDPAGPAAFLLRVDAILPADPDAPGIGQLRRQIDAQAVQSISADILQAFGQQIMRTREIEIEDPALNAVHSQVFN